MAPAVLALKHPVIRMLTFVERGAKGGAPSAYAEFTPNEMLETRRVSMAPPQKWGELLPLSSNARIIRYPVAMLETAPFPHTVNPGPPALALSETDWGAADVAAVNTRLAPDAFAPSPMPTVPPAAREGLYTLRGVGEVPEMAMLATPVKGLLPRMRESFTAMPLPLFEIADKPVMACVPSAMFSGMLTPAPPLDTIATPLSVLCENVTFSGTAIPAPPLDSWVTPEMACVPRARFSGMEIPPPPFPDARHPAQRLAPHRNVLGHGDARAAIGQGGHSTDGMPRQVYSIGNGQTLPAVVDSRQLECAGAREGGGDRREGRV